MSDYESDLEQDNMDICDGPTILVGETNTLNYTIVTESPVSVTEDRFLSEETDSESSSSFILDDNSNISCSRPAETDVDVTQVQNAGRNILRENMDGNTSDEDAWDIKSKCTDDHETTSTSSEENERNTNVASYSVHKPVATSFEDADTRTYTTSDCSEINNEISGENVERFSHSQSSESEFDDQESSEERRLQPLQRQIHMCGPNNTVNIFSKGEIKHEIAMDGDTKVIILYDLDIKRAAKGHTPREEPKPKIKLDIDKDSAVDAVFVAMHRRPFRGRLDTLFQVINHAIDLIVPGSIIIEIKPTSENSIRSLLEAVDNGKFDDIIKEILSQESVFKHIKGKKVTVTVELNIPEELLEKEGILVVDDPKSIQIDTGSDVTVTLKEEEDADDDRSSQSSSVDPPDIPAAQADLSSSVDPVLQESVSVNEEAVSVADVLHSTAASQDMKQPSRESSGLKADFTAGTSSGYIRRKQKNYQKLTVGSLKGMTMMEPSEILTRLINKKRDFQFILSQKLNRQGALIVLSVLCKVCKCDSMPVLLNELLTIVLSGPFLGETFVSFLGYLEDNDPSLREAIANIVPLLREILQRMPTDGWTKVNHLALLIKGKWMTSKQGDTNVSKVCDDLFDIVKVTKPQSSEFTRGIDEEDEDFVPPESYRKLPIIPRKEELDGSVDIFLLANKVGKRFSDLEQYLECQFRLFRADVLLPLKQNIEEFRTMSGKSSKSYRVYSDVQIIRPVCSENGLGYRISFDPKPLRRVRWDTSQRLIFGSLLCLSSDKFTDKILFATVDNRETASLKKGLVDVQFLSDDLDISALSRDIRFDMVESPAYFESYKDVLKGMQTLNERTLPFQDYIVGCQSIVKEPEYIQKNKDELYDLRPLVDHNYKITEQTFSCESSVATKVQIQNRNAWPPIDDVDSSQLTAIQNALTREFALIHGPPGTGKTYVGIKILKVLLHNSQLWLQGQPQIPILVVCYTNHALDQFLEGILSTFSGKLIRVGGRIKSDLLQQYSLKNARSRVKQMKAVPSHLHEARMVTQRTMNRLKGDINKIADKIEVAEREIIHEEYLKPLMNMKLALQFQERSPLSKKSSFISAWLGIERRLAEFDETSQELPDQEEGDDEEEIDDNDLAVSENVDLQESHFSQRRLEEDTLDIFFDYDSDDSTKSVEECPLEDKTSYIAVNVTSLDDDFQQYFRTRSEAYAYKQKLKRRRELKAYLMQEIRSTDRMTQSEENKISDIWKLKHRDRWRLYRYWVNVFSELARKDIKNKEGDYRKNAAKFKEIMMQEDKIILESCSVIGMTTTGAARYHMILNEIGPRIIVVEEAAEVLEAHIIGTLSKKCQHLILIGDHKQLRPNPTVHELAKKYNLEISLFERMVKSGIHCDMLEWQHRMRPEIADTIRSLYEGRLKDHDVVSRFADVKGIGKNVYFIEHQETHDFDEETKSFQNKHEAEYLVALCKYLLKQGYRKDQITVLTFYSAQLHCLKRKMPKSVFNGVRVVAVDSYQGEENDIILLSLVRSKPEGAIGFLKEENRICVALSRAKIGMYVIGNFSHIAKHSDLLRQICTQANDDGNLGPALPLCCQRHPTEAQVGAVDPNDFEAVPEGGCTKPCDYRLPCGHVCPKMCHASDPDHKDYLCTKPCKKRCRNGHANCSEMCCKPCSPCQELSRTTLPNCGHIQDIPCHLDPKEYQCQEKCSEILDCGHTCPGLCGAPHETCCEHTDINLPCGHCSPVPCGQRDTFPCNHPCGTVLKCGHTCQGTCGGCHQGKLHLPCTQKCTRILICGHKCESTCNNCPPCERPCENRCSHSICKQKCGEPCATCKEPCDKKCRHSKCGSDCGQICDRKRCNEKCRKKLGCGHPCIGLCGEPCPPVCRQCNKTELTEIHSLFGTEDKPTTRIIQLEDCGHIFEVSSLDKWMDETTEDENKTVVKLKECPRCRLPIRRSQRYANIIKISLEAVERVKAKVKGNEKRLREQKESLSRFTRRFAGQDRMMIEQLTQTERVPSETILSTQFTQIHIFSQVVSIEKKIIQRDVRSKNLEKVYNTLLRDIKTFKNWLMIPRSCFGKQEVDDSTKELARLSLLRSFVDANNTISIEETNVPKDVLERLRSQIEHLLLSGAVPASNLNDAKELQAELQKYVPGVKIGISDEERMIIVEAIGLNKGHWYKCKKGHVYAIGECGRAYEEATCPECGGAIGGTSHQLSEDNAWAPEMDNADEPPWSEEMDLVFALRLHQELNG